MIDNYIIILNHICSFFEKFIFENEQYESLHFIEDFNRDELRKFLQNDNIVVRHARCIIVGCAGAGKTTLLRRLEGATFKELKDVPETKSVDVHISEFEVLENKNTIKRKVYDSDCIIINLINILKPMLVSVY